MARRLLAAFGVSNHLWGAKLRRALGTEDGFCILLCGDVEPNPGPGARPAILTSGRPQLLANPTSLWKTGVRLAEFNCCGLFARGRTLNEVAEELDSANIDICLLVETKQDKAQQGRRVAAKSGRFYVFAWAAGRGGVGLAVRAEIFDARAPWHIEELRVDDDRVLSFFLVDPAGRRTKCVGVYFPTAKDSDEIKNDVMLRVCKRVPPSASCIVLGDFNEHPKQGGLLHDTLEALGMKDAMSSSNRRSRWTWHGYRGSCLRGRRATLDYVFGRGVELARTRARDTRLTSDHRMVVTEVRAPTKGTQRKCTVAGLSKKQAFPQGADTVGWGRVRARICKYGKKKPHPRGSRYISETTWDLIGTKLQMQSKPGFRRDSEWAAKAKEVSEAVKQDRETWVQAQATKAQEQLKRGNIHEAYVALWPFNTRRARNAGSLPSWEQLAEATEGCRSILVSGVQPPQGVVRQEVTGGPPVAAPRPCRAVREQQAWVDVYTDGSATEAGGETSAGFGVFVPDFGGASIERKGRVNGVQTAQRGEVSAAVVALMTIPMTFNVRIFTDSTYVCLGIAKLTRFRADGAEGVEHADLWRAAAMLARDRCVETCKVKAHTGVSGNERADRLANEGRLEAMGADLGVEEIPKSGWDGEVPDDPPTDEEISEAVRHLRSYKAAGLDGITAEILKAALENESCQREFSECLRSVWSSGEVPQQWCDTPCVWIPKSSGGHRIVGLLALAWKVMARILLKRMEAFPIGPEQNGFSRGRSTLFPILTLRMLVDEARRKGRRLFACFLDLKQAYYSVDRQRLFDVLQRYGVQEHAMRIIRTAYAQERAAVKVNGRFGKSFHGERGVKTGDVVSPRLFNMVLDAVLRQMETEWECDDWEGIPLSPMFYADDGLLVGWSEEVVQRGLNLFASLCADLGLYISVSKTQAMCFKTARVWQHMSKEAYEVARLGMEHPNYMTSKERVRRLRCDRCGAITAKLRQHYNTKYCRKFRAHAPPGGGPAGTPGEEALDANVTRGSGGRVVLDMPSRGGPMTKCPFVECQARFKTRADMQDHLRERHLEDVVFVLRGNRDRGRQERQCEKCGLFVARCQFKKHEGSMRCRRFMERKLTASYLAERSRIPTPLQVYGETIAWTDEFVYLGRTFDSDGDDLAAIDQRRTAALRSWGTLRQVLGKRMKVGVRRVFCKVILHAALLYGCETWTLDGRIIQRLRSTQDIFLRTVTGIRGSRQDGKWRFPQAYVQAGVRSRF